MKQRYIFYYRQFVQQPLWFKLLVPICFVITVLFSSSLFSDPIYSAISKLAAAIFFSVFGYKFRRTIKLSILFFALSAVCLCLAWFSIR